MDFVITDTQQEFKNKLVNYKTRMGEAVQQVYSDDLEIEDIDKFNLKGIEISHLSKVCYAKSKR